MPSHNSTTEPSRVRQFWLSGLEGELAVSLFEPAAGAPNAHAVVISRSLGHEDQTTDSGLFALAGECAAAGFPALIVSHRGTDQSSGAAEGVDAVGGWLDGIRLAVDFLREQGHKSCTLVSPRLGALLCASALPIDGVTAFVMWSPVLDGRRYIRSLKLLGAAATDAAKGSDGNLSIAGYDFSAPVLRSLESLKAQPYIGCERVLVLESASRRIDSTFIESLRNEGADVVVVDAPDVTTWIDQPSDTSNIPTQSIRSIVSFIAQTARTDATPTPSAADTPLARNAITLRLNGAEINERFVSFGPDQLSGVLSTPSPDRERSVPAVLLLSTRGPGRSFVDLARELSADGRMVLRYDFAGFGASPQPSGDDLLYSSQGERDLAAGVNFLASLGQRRVVVVGFCAGAWTAISAPPQPGVCAIAAINVELFVTDENWVVRNYRSARINAIMHRLDVHGRSRRLMALLPQRHAAVRWLGRLAGRHVFVGLFFDEADYGFRFYQMKVRPAIAPSLAAGTVRVHQYSDLGHMTQGADRHQMTADLIRFINDADNAAQISPRAH